MIASAAESSFIYVEDNDQVVDAFGGALGAQQGMAAKNIELNITALAENVRIDEVKSGEYVSRIGSGRRTATVMFANLFAGEKREVLVKLLVPSVATAVAQYPLYEISTSFTPVGSDGRVQSQPTENGKCLVDRVSGEVDNNAKNRHIEVDAHVCCYLFCSLLLIIDVSFEGIRSS